MNNNQIEHEINKLIKICHANLKNSDQCLDYLKNIRGLSESSISHFKLGYFPRNVSKLMNFVNGDILKKISVVDYSETSKFSDYFYLVFPIFSEYGESVAVGGRTLISEEQRRVLDLPKYKNSSFKKANYLYGLDKARAHILKEQNVYVVEGYFDCISLHSNDIRNTVAICGTAFSKMHMVKLARYTDKITFILDRDDGGKASMRNIKLKFLNKGIKLRFKLVPEGYKDADEYFSSGKTKKEFLKDLEDYNSGW